MTIWVLGIGVIYVLHRTPNLKTKTTPKFGGCEFLFVKNLMSELLRRKTDGASQFIGNSLKDFVVLLVWHSLQGQESWFPRPKFFPWDTYLSAWFSLTALVVKIWISYQKTWGLGIRHPSEYLFLPSKKSIPDAILIPCSQSPPYEYIEGGDFRKSFKLLIYFSNYVLNAHESGQGQQEIIELRKKLV